MTTSVLPVIPEISGGSEADCKLTDNQNVDPQHISTTTEACPSCGVAISFATLPSLSLLLSKEMQDENVSPRLSRKRTTEDQLKLCLTATTGVMSESPSTTSTPRVKAKSILKSAENKSPSKPIDDGAVQDPLVAPGRRAVDKSLSASSTPLTSARSSTAAKKSSSTAVLPTTTTASPVSATTALCCPTCGTKGVKVKKRKTVTTAASPTAETKTILSPPSTARSAKAVSEVTDPAAAVTQHKRSSKTPSSSLSAVDSSSCAACGHATKVTSAKRRPSTNTDSAKVTPRPPTATSSPQRTPRSDRQPTQDAVTPTYSAHTMPPLYPPYARANDAWHNDPPMRDDHYWMAKSRDHHGPSAGQWSQFSPYWSTKSTPRDMRSDGCMPYTRHYPQPTSTPQHPYEYAMSPAASELGRGSGAHAPPTAVQQLASAEDIALSHIALGARGELPVSDEHLLTVCHGDTPSTLLLEGGWYSDTHSYTRRSALSRVCGRLERIALESRQLASHYSVLLYSVPRRSRNGGLNNQWHEANICFHDGESWKEQRLHMLGCDDVTGEFIWRGVVSKRNRFAKVPFFIRDGQVEDERDHPQATWGEAERNLQLPGNYYLMSERSRITSLRDGETADGDRITALGVTLSIFMPNKAHHSAVAEWNEAVLHYLDPADGIWKDRPFVSSVVPHLVYNLEDVTADASNTTALHSFKGAATTALGMRAVASVTLLEARGVQFVVRNSDGTKWLKNLNRDNFQVHFSGDYAISLDGVMADFSVLSLQPITTRVETWFPGFSPQLFEIGTPRCSSAESDNDPAVTTVTLHSPLPAATPRK